jgi:hypothetical protein
MKKPKSLRMTVTVNPALFEELHDYLEKQPSRLRSLKICELAEAGLNGSPSDLKSFRRAVVVTEADQEDGASAGPDMSVLSGLSASMS